MSTIGSNHRVDSSSGAGLDAFISEHYGLMSYREMADALGVSKSTIGNHVRALGLSEGRASTQLKAALDRVEREPDAPENDQLRGLYELRDMQRSMLREGVSMQSFASISREYRETMRQIAELQTAGTKAEPDEPDLAGPMADLLAAMPDLSSLASMPGDG